MRYSVTFVFVVATAHAAAADSVTPVRAVKPQQRLRTAVTRGLQIVQKGARNYPSHRKCYSCHHQTLPLLAMKHARDVGVRIDEKLFGEVVAFTRRSFRSRIENLKQGRRIGGRATTVGYGLWTLQIAGEKPDDLSAAMVTYLLKTQEESGRWQPPSQRPPLEESRVTCTLFALYGMEEYQSESQQAKVTAAGKTARTWLQSAPLKSTEDRVMLLFARHLLDGDAKKVAEARKAVVNLQQKDGGWAQKPGMSSDAYATGQALFVLMQTGVKPGSPVIRRGIESLLQTQKPDGSWFVKTRSRPVQVFFDNGDPHGKSQFISIAATSWATAALAESLKHRR